MSAWIQPHLMLTASGPSRLLRQHFFVVRTTLSCVSDLVTSQTRRRSQ